MEVKLFQHILLAIALFSNFGLFAYASFLSFESIKEAICAPSNADVEVLKRPKSWLLKMNESDAYCLDSGYSTPCNFTFAFCQPMNCSKTLGNAAACIETNGTVYKLGSYNPQVNPFFGGDTAFEVHFGDGSPYHHDTGKPCGLNVGLRFECDETRPGDWGVSTEGKQRQLVNRALLKRMEYSDLYCEYTFYFSYNHYGLCPKPPAQSVISAGSVLLIMFFVCLTLYCVIGSVYNYSHGRRGGAIIPQSEFWSDLPGYITEGCRFTCRCCRPDSHTTQYESI